MSTARALTRFVLFVLTIALAIPALTMGTFNGLSLIAVVFAICFIITGITWGDESS